MLDAASIADIWTSPAAVEDFRTLCSFGGRYAGTPGETNAREFLAARLEQILGTKVVRHPVPYLGWERIGARLSLRNGVSIAANPLGRSPGVDGLRTRLLDLGRGTRRDFEAAAGSIPGRIVMVRHEYMLASGLVHRRDKYRWAKEFGAAGFIVAGNVAGQLTVTGSAGTGAEDDIPAIGVSLEDSFRIAAQDGHIELTVEGRFEERVSENLLIDVPGRGPGLVVASAHIDGHHLCENAIDNTSGLVALLLAARCMAELAQRGRHGLRIALFNVEEWGVIGSRHYLQSLPEDERRRIVLNINLDSVAGSSGLTVLTSGLGDCEELVDRVNDTSPLALSVERPFLGNSDHGNFIRQGIPALRLCAGWNQPDSNLRFLLTPADTPDKVSLPEIGVAATAAVLLFGAALERERIRFDRPAVLEEI